MNQTREFQATLQSFSYGIEFLSNRPQSYKTQLATPLELHGKWEVALMEIEYPRNWFNLQSPAIVTFIEGANGHDGIVKHGDLLDMYNQAVPYSMRCESVNFWDAAIKAGYYATPSDLGNRIVGACNEGYNACVRAHTGKDIQFEFKYDAIDGRCTFHGSRLVMLFPNQSPLLRMLNLGLNQANADYSFDVTPVRSSSPPCNEWWTSMYVFTDIIQPQLVGDALLPLLAVVPVMSKEFEVAHWTFNPPYYLPLSRSYISNVEIELKTLRGELLPIQNGKVTCRLHFRKVSDD